jgi:Double-GTPase 2
VGTLLIILVAAAAYLALLGLGLVLLGPIVAGLMAAYFALRYLACYLTVTIEALTMPGSPRTPAVTDPPSRSPGPGEQPAYRQYFFSQCFGDVRHVLDLTRRGCREATTDAVRTIKLRLFDRDDLALVTWPTAVVAWIGMLAGGLAGLAAVAALFAVLVVVVVVLQLGAVAMAMVLRGLDTVLLRLRSIVIRCPACFRRIPYPSYACPSTTCGVRHSDVRPGRYGILSRTCVCDQRLPTLILLGSYRLAAFCPFTGCGERLPDRSGTTRELHLPLLGATAAGKTRLMLALLLTFEQQAAEGGSFSIADDDTQRRYGHLRQVIVDNHDTRRTTMVLPRAYTLYVRLPGRPERLVHLFDAAGERANESERLQELGYLRNASSFLFVIDPLSVDGLWDSLAPHERDDLARFRLQAPPAEFVAQQVVHNLQTMGVDTGRTRLAVSISKSDLLERVSALGDRRNESSWIEGWLEERLGLDNLVRLLRTEFGEVTYFFTAAVTSADGVVDPSVATLAQWLFDGTRRRRPAESLRA